APGSASCSAATKSRKRRNITSPCPSSKMRRKWRRKLRRRPRPSRGRRNKGPSASSPARRREQPPGAEIHFEPLDREQAEREGDQHVRERGRVQQAPFPTLERRP